MKAARIHEYGKGLVIDEINDICARLKRGEIKGRAVITPNG